MDSNDKRELTTWNEPIRRKEMLKTILKQASKFLLSENYDKSMLLFEEIKRMFIKDRYLYKFDLYEMDLCVIDYALAKTYAMDEAHFSKGVTCIMEIFEYGTTFPPLYYALAVLLCKQGCFTKATHVINNALDFLSNITNGDAFKANWPCLDVEIVESNITVLIDMLRALRKDCIINSLMEETPSYSELENCFHYTASSKDESERVSLKKGNYKDGDNFNVNSKRQEFLNTEVNMSKNEGTNVDYIDENIYDPHFSFTQNLGFSNVQKMIIEKHEIVSGKLNSVLLKLDANEEYQEKRRVEACGMSINTLTTIKKRFNEAEIENESVQCSSKRLRCKLKSVDIDNYIKDFVKRKIYEMHTNRQHFTVESFRQEILESGIRNLEYEVKLQKDAAAVDLEKYCAQVKNKEFECVQLKTRIEELTQILKKNEGTLQIQEKRIKSLETSLIEQYLQSCLRQKQEITRCINKSIDMISDLNFALPYLTWRSIPTLDECRRSMLQWERQLQLAKEDAHAVEFYNTCLEKAKRDDWNIEVKCPEMRSNITELGSILHNSYVGAVRHFLQKDLHMSQINPPITPNYGTWIGMYPQQSVQPVPNQYYHKQLKGAPLQSTLNNKVPVPHGIPSSHKQTIFADTVAKPKSFELSRNCDQIKVVMTDTELKSSPEVSGKKIVEVPTDERLEMSGYQTNNVPAFFSADPKEIEDVSSEENESSNVFNVKSDISNENRNKETEIQKHDKEGTNPVAIIPKNSEVATTFCNNLDVDNDFPNLNYSVENKDMHNTSTAAKAAGGLKFHNLFLKVKTRITNCSDEEVLTALKKVRQKKTKLTGMSLTDIVEIVQEELKSIVHDTWQVYFLFAMDSYDSDQPKEWDDPLAARKGSMMNVLKRASEYLVLEDYTAAMMLFEKVKMMSIKNGHLYMFDINDMDLCVIDYALIKIYATNELYFSKGVQCLKQVLENATTFPPLYYGIAVLLYKQQRIIEAKRVINKALDFLSYIRRDDFFRANWPCSEVEITESNVTVLIKMLESLRKDCINSEMKECGDDCYGASSENESKTLKEKISKKFYYETVSKLFNMELNVESVEYWLEEPRRQYPFINYTKNVGGIIKKYELFHYIWLFSYEADMVTVPLNNGEDFYDIIQCLTSTVNENILIQEKFQNMVNERDDTINNQLNLILLKLEENQKFQEKIVNLECEVKSQKDAAMDLEKHNALQDKSKDFERIKLETAVEELNKTLKNQEEILQMQEKKIEYLESSLTKQYLQFHLSQKQEITKHVNKSVHMVSNLNLALPYLTWCSAPTADECGKSIMEWKRHLQYVKELSHAVDNFYNTCLRQIKRVDCCMELENPHLCSDINEPRDILHDNYIPAVHYFLNKDYEMWIGRHQRQSLHVVPMHYQYNQPRGPTPQFNKFSTLNNSIFNIPNGPVPSHSQNVSVDTTAHTRFWELSPNYNQTKVLKTDAKLNIIPEVSGKKLEVMTDEKLEIPDEHRFYKPVTIQDGLVSSHRQNIFVDATASTKFSELSPNYNQTKVVKTDAKLNIIPELSGKKVEVMTEQDWEIPDEHRFYKFIKNTSFSPSPFKSDIEDKVVAVPYQHNEKFNEWVCVKIKNSFSATHERESIIYTRVIQRRRETENLQPKQGHHGGRLHQIEVNVEEEILDMVDADLTRSIWQIAKEVEVSQSFVWNTLHINGLYPHHFQRMQGLIPEADAMGWEEKKETEMLKNQKLPTNTFATIPKVDATTTTSCNNSDLDNDVPDLNDSFQKKDEHITSVVNNAVGGSKFHNLFLKVKSRITDYSEAEVLNALKGVRQKKVKLTGLSLSKIVEIVQEELKGTVYNTCVDTSTKRAIKQDPNGETNNSNICIFCYEQYDETSKTILKCQHSFHLKVS
ncbi:hypothetical protein FQA39_LY00506 [Lamprigera yunnana]|nr:hypothetical protein FQA39_LY00506 [Lamprigera yunnana]